MRSFKDISTEHRTQLQTRVQVGRRHETVTVCIPGRDVWAYQMARIQLQEKENQTRKRLASGRSRVEPPPPRAPGARINRLRQAHRRGTAHPSEVPDEH